MIVVACRHVRDAFTAFRPIDAEQFRQGAGEPFADAWFYCGQSDQDAFMPPWQLSKGAAERRDRIDAGGPHGCHEYCLARIVRPHARRPIQHVAVGADAGWSGSL
jgi:hypothetical protein